MNDILNYLTIFWWPMFLIITMIILFFLYLKKKTFEYHPLNELKIIWMINEKYWPSDRTQRSLVLKILHIVFIIIRLLSPLQYMKVYFKNQRGSTSNKNGYVPAWLNEIYILIWLIYNLIVFKYFTQGQNIYSFLIIAIISFRLIEIVYSCLYYNLFRPTYSVRTRVHNFYRSIVLIIINYIEIAIIFAIYYKIYFNEFNKPYVLKENINAVYYSIVTITTLGYGDIFPEGNIGKYLTVIEVLIGMMIVIIALSSVISFIRNPGDYYSSDTTSE